jgi:hypothetical protein
MRVLDWVSFVQASRALSSVDSRCETGASSVHVTGEGTTWRDRLKVAACGVWLVMVEVEEVAVQILHGKLA